MEDDQPRIFSLPEANETVEAISSFTAEVVSFLESVRKKYPASAESNAPALPETVVREVERVLRQWDERVARTGALPKGYFTVDFRSADPELLYCWTYGESEIAFAHKIWENFTHRRPLSEAAGTVDHMKWVH